MPKWDGIKYILDSDYVVNTLSAETCSNDTALIQITVVEDDSQAAYEMCAADAKEFGEHLIALAEDKLD